MTDMTTIGEIAYIFDGPHATPNKTGDGPYFLNIASLQNGRLVLADSAHLSDEDFVRWTKRVTPRENDLLFSYETRLGEAALMPAGIKACLGRRMGLLRPKVDKIDPQFFLYSYLGPLFQHEILANTIKGATVERISVSEIGNFKIRVPSKLEQEKVAAVLSALDAKIDLNNRINAELEALAKTIYDYWFMQFDFPDANGRPYKSSGGKMVYNETLKREIPVGWEDVPLRSLVECNARSYGVNNLPGEIDYLDTSNLTGNRLFDLERIDTRRDKVPSRARRSVANNDVLYSTVRPNQSHHGIIKESMGNLVASTGFAVLTCTEEYLNGDFVYMFVRTNDVAVRMQRIAESSRSSYPSIAPDDLLDARLALPKNRVQIRSVCLFFDRTFGKIWANQEQNRELTQLRDWLLPLLMNGQVRVA